MVGIVVDADGDLSGVDEARSALFAAGIVPLVVAAHGGTVGDGLEVQRTFATARSVEFDAVLVAGCPAPSPDAVAARDAKAGADTSAALDPRVALLLSEAWRHAKAIGAWGAGTDAITAAGIDEADLGMVAAENGSDVVEAVLLLMGAHRVWDRFATSA
jgi:catalase